MNRPIIYNQTNGLQRDANLKCLKENTQRIEWLKIGDSAIDVGCGDGSFSVFLKNYKPHDDFYYRKFVGVDINKNMIKFAKERFEDDEISFKVLDIEGHIPKTLQGGFNHVFSFFALHYAKDQEKAFNNIYSLLTDGGDVLINLIENSIVFKIYDILSQQPKWCTKVKHMDSMKSPYHDMKNSKEKVAAILKNCGFKDVDVQCKELTYVYHSKQDIRNLVLSLDPFNMSPDMLEEFLDDFLTCFKELGCIKNNVNIHNDTNLTYEHDYTLLVIYAKK